MKKLLILMNFAVLVLLISSCDGLLNPDPEVHKTKIKHHIIVKDQEHSVIMPLKIGNMWIYKVSDVSNDGKTKFIGYDTILVKRDTIINGEIWFIAKDPSSNDKDVVLTNTDVGLLCNPDCFCGLLRAEYPAKYSTYLYLKNFFPDQIRYYNDLGELIDQKIIYRDAYFWIDEKIIENYPVFDDNFVCYKYSMRAVFEENGKMLNITKFEPGIDYFIPDLGLVRKDFCKYNDDTPYIYKRMELIFTNVKI